jgi:NAD(P)-dependent dehydrogenase (short-subunit alcohol dehydrogenase family)
MVETADIRERPNDIDVEVPTHEAIPETSGKARHVETHVSEPDQLESVVEEAREFGGVDVMVNNAALLIGGPYQKITPEEFDQIHAVNARGAFFGTQAAANDMID